MMAAGMLLLLLLLVNLGLLLDAAAQLACEQSGICSLGKVKPFFGDVGTSKFRLTSHVCLQPRTPCLGRLYG